MRIISVLALGILLSTLTRAQTSLGELLPAENDVAGWRPSGEPRTFNRDQLRLLAGKDAGIIEEYGFTKALRQEYYNYNDRHITVEVYIMNNSLGACGLFTRNSRKQSVFREYGNSAYAKDGEYGFWKHLYFVRLLSVAADDTVKVGFRMIAAFMDSKIRSKGTSPEILGLTRGKTGTFTIFRGPLALSEIYYFGPQNIFFADEGLAIENADSREIIFKYADNNEAVRRFSDAAGLMRGMNRYSDFRLIDNFTFSLKDRDRNNLVFKVSENVLDVTIRK